MRGRSARLCRAFRWIFVVPPAVFLLIKWAGHNQTCLHHLFLSIALFIIPTAIFYSAVYLQVRADDDTVRYWYWYWRVFGKPKKTTALFSLYNGWVATYLYLLLGGVGIATFFTRTRKFALPLAVVWLAPGVIWIAHLHLLGPSATKPYFLPVAIFVAAVFTIISLFIQGSPKSCAAKAWFSGNVNTDATP